MFSPDLIAKLIGPVFHNQNHTRRAYDVSSSTQTAANLENIQNPQNIITCLFSVGQRQKLLKARVPRKTNYFNRLLGQSNTRQWKKR